MRLRWAFIRLFSCAVVCAICIGTARAGDAGVRAACAGAASGADAGSNGAAADTLYWAPEILVEADRIRPDTDAYHHSGFVALIDMRRHRDRMEDIPSVLARSVGLRVKQYGGLGGFATLSIRGSSSSQVQVFMDGVPLNDAYTGVADLADFSPDGLERIEVFRGFGPAVFGSSAIGGAVNLVTGRDAVRSAAGGTASVRALASAGSFGTRRYLLAVAAPLRFADINGSVSRQRTDGAFTFHDDNATEENPYDDVISERMNNDFTRWNITGRLGLHIPGFTDVSINYHSVVREGGVPGIGTNQSTVARSERDRRLAYCKIEPEPLFAKRLHLGATGYYSRAAERFTDPGSDIALVSQQTDNRITYHGGSIRSQLFTPVLPLSASLFFEGRKDRFHPVSHLPQTVIGPDRLRETQTLSVSGDCWLLEGRIALNAAIRHQWHGNEFYDEPRFPWLPPTPAGTVRRHDRSPSFGVRIHPASALTIKGNWGRYHRPPTFFELFGNLGSVTGAADLENETGLNRDIGVIVSAERFLAIERPFIELVYCSNTVENLILFFPNSQRTVKPRNIGSASIEGFELSVSGSLGASLAVAGNYTYLDSRDTGPVPKNNGNELAGRPRHDASCSFVFERSRWSLAYDLQYISANFLDRANHTRVPARSIHNLGLGLTMHEYGALLMIEVRNIADSQVSDIYGYPLPGRSFYTTLSVHP
jgi:iron complex outermembrane receptor protein